MVTNEVMMSGVQLKKLIEKKSEFLHQKYDLRPVEMEILMLLYQANCGDTATDIMNCKHISKAHVSKSIDNLKARALICLHTDKHDHRVIHIELLNRAETVIQEIRGVYDECKRIVFQNISEDEISCMTAVLQKISLNITRELEQE
ncbi:MAG: MarR family winged helix-turn-helix transcriptional regulator [Oscillospiraceae bacterium]|jgi:MarR family transcriptional regulator for hemolysin